MPEPGAGEDWGGEDDGPAPGTPGGGHPGEQGPGGYGGNGYGGPSPGNEPGSGPSPGTPGEGHPGEQGPGGYGGNGYGGPSPGNEPGNEPGPGNDPGYGPSPGTPGAGHPGEQGPGGYGNNGYGGGNGGGYSNPSGGGWTEADLDDFAKSFDDVDNFDYGTGANNQSGNTPHGYDDYSNGKSTTGGYDPGSHTSKTGYFDGDTYTETVTTRANGVTTVTTSETSSTESYSKTTVNGAETSSSRTVTDNNGNRHTTTISKNGNTISESRHTIDEEGNLRSHSHKHVDLSTNKSVTITNKFDEDGTRTSTKTTEDLSTSNRDLTTVETTHYDKHGNVVGTSKSTYGYHDEDAEVTRQTTHYDENGKVTGTSVGIPDPHNAGREITTHYNENGDKVGVSYDYPGQEDGEFFSDVDLGDTRSISVNDDPSAPSGGQQTGPGGSNSGGSGPTGSNNSGGNDFTGSGGSGSGGNSDNNFGDDTEFGKVKYAQDYHADGTIAEEEVTKQYSYGEVHNYAAYEAEEKVSQTKTYTGKDFDPDNTSGVISAYNYKVTLEIFFNVAGNVDSVDVELIFNGQAYGASYDRDDLAGLGNSTMTDTEVHGALSALLGGDTKELSVSENDYETTTKQPVASGGFVPQSTDTGTNVTAEEPDLKPADDEGKNTHTPEVPKSEPLPSNVAQEDPHIDPPAPEPLPSNVAQEDPHIDPPAPEPLPSNVVQEDPHIDPPAPEPLPSNVVQEDPHIDPPAPEHPKLDVTAEEPEVNPGEPETPNLEDLINDLLDDIVEDVINDPEDKEVIPDAPVVEIPDFTAPEAANDYLTVTGGGGVGNVLANDAASNNGVKFVSKFTLNGVTYNAGDTVKTAFGDFTMHQNGYYILKDRPDPTVTSTTSFSESYGSTTIMGGGGGMGMGYTTTHYKTIYKTTTFHAKSPGGSLKIGYTVENGLGDSDNATLNVSVKAFSETKTVTQSKKIPMYTYDNHNQESDGNSEQGHGGDSMSPLVLDLDGDGVELTDKFNGVAFDMDLDGVKDQTAWAAPDDGLLALDENGDGVINDRSELFGDTGSFTDGFNKLASYDDNNDGIIDKNDEVFAELVVWQDADMDGISDEGEMFSLTDLGIVSISLNADLPEDMHIEGNWISHVSSFQTEDGQSHEIVDAWFEVDVTENADVDDILYINDEQQDILDMVFETIEEGAEVLKETQDIGQTGDTIANVFVSAPEAVDVPSDSSVIV